jgi:GH43 family beta-xylosidase
VGQFENITQSGWRTQRILPDNHPLRTWRSLRDAKTFQIETLSEFEKARTGFLYYIAILYFAIMKKTIILVLVYFLLYQAGGQGTYTNPLKASGPDPWVLFSNGWYYYMNTTGNELKLWRTKNLGQLAAAEEKIIFKPEEGKAYSKQLWAPEIHFLDEKWYVYFAADEGNNLHHRMWVLENGNKDPFSGDWVLKGKLADPGDHWAIDLTVIDYKGKRYAAWSGWEHYNNVQQNIYIAELENPWTMKGDRVLISQPTFEWELKGAVPLEWQKNTGEPPNLRINEGPQFLQNNGKLFIIYSANACWLDYNLGMLVFNNKGNILDPKNWKKNSRPVFVQSPENSVYAPGHNSFFKSPDGKEDWILYHANPTATDGCGGKRAPHMQKFTWNNDGTPNFGKPVPKKPLPLPSGTLQ